MLLPSLAGSDFRVNSLISGTQDWPRVAGFGNNFFVVWESESSAGADNAPNSIEGRIVTNYNQFPSSQFLINQYTDQSQGFPGISGYKGRIATAWRSQRNAETSENVIEAIHRSYRSCSSGLRRGHQLLYRNSSFRASRRQLPA